MSRASVVIGEAANVRLSSSSRRDPEHRSAHMIGAEVTELIQGYTIAKTLETTEAELIHTIFPHPTLSETMHEAVLDAYGQVIYY